MSSALKRNTIVLSAIAAGCLAAIGGLVWYTMSDTPQGPRGKSDVASAKPVTVRQDRQLTPAQTQAVDGFDASEADKAAARGQSYAPGMIVGQRVPASDPGETPVATAGSGPTPADYQREDNRRRAQNEEEERRRRLLAQEAKDQQDAYAAALKLAAGQIEEGLKATGKVPSMETFRMPVGKTGDNQAGSSPQASATPTSGATGIFSSIVVVKALDIASAVLEAPIDTAKSSMVLARIVGGPLDGAMLRGKATIVNDEGLRVDFTMMAWKGGSRKIEAVALDEASSLDALEAGVRYDRKVMERWVLPITMAAVGGYHQALSQTGSTTMSGIGGSTVINQPSSADQARSAGISKATGMAEKRIDKEAEKPITARIERGASIGVIFGADVKE